MCVASSFAGFVAGAVILSMISTCLPILIPALLVSCCVGIGIRSRNRRLAAQVVTTAAPPPPTAAVVPTMSRLTGMSEVKL